MLIISYWRGFDVNCVQHQTNAIINKFEWMNVCCVVFYVLFRFVLHKCLLVLLLLLSETIRRRPSDNIIALCLLIKFNKYMSLSLLSLLDWTLWGTFFTFRAPDGCLMCLTRSHDSFYMHVLIYYRLFICTMLQRECKMGMETTSKMVTVLLKFIHWQSVVPSHRHTPNWSNPFCGATRCEYAFLGQPSKVIMINFSLYCWHVLRSCIEYSGRRCQFQGSYLDGWSNSFDAKAHHRQWDRIIICTKCKCLDQKMSMTIIEHCIGCTDKKHRE